MTGKRILVVDDNVDARALAGVCRDNDAAHERRSRAGGDDELTNDELINY
jgi:hypothetical protein